MSNPDDSGQGRETLTGRTIVRGTVYHAVQFVLTGALLPILVTPLIYHRLGPNHFGLWALLVTLGSWFLFLDLGINLGVAKFYGQYSGVGDFDRIRKLCGTLFYTYSGLTVAVVGLGLFLAHPLLTVFVGDHAHPGDDRALVLLFGFHFLLSFLRSVAGALAGFQEIESASKVSIGMGMIQGLAIWVWSRQAWEPLLSTLSAVYLLTTALHALGLVALLYRTSRRSRFSLSLRLDQVDGSLFRTVIGFSGVLYLTQLLMNLMVSDRLYLGWIRAPMDQIAEYHLGAQLVAKAASVMSVFAVAVYPAAAALEARQDMRRLERLTHQTFQVYALAGFFVFIFLGVHADRIFRVWLGQDMPFAVKAVWILSGWGLTGILGSLGAVAAGMGNPHIQLKSGLVALACMIIQYPIVIRPWGPLGLAAALSISFAISGLVYVHLFRKNVLPLRLSFLLRDGLVKPLTCAAAAVLPLSYALSKFDATSRTELAAVLAAGFAGSLLLYLLFYVLFLRQGMDTSGTKLTTP